MHVNLAPNESHAIQAYSDHEIQINSKKYSASLIVSQHEIIDCWTVNFITDLNEETIQPLLKYKPNIILIGYIDSKPDLLQLHQLKQMLETQFISIELTSIGAACRTFNILLCEHRDVVLGIIQP